ncbi:MAG: TauD/TfdA family dioxygenase [Moorea sp. SIO2B7]|nr:TauD/TfdA family dioxygenase [Moorena sp. SIO2B7]
MINSQKSKKPDRSCDLPFKIRPLSTILGAEIIGVSLDQAVRPAIFPSIYEVFLQYQLVLFEDINLVPDQIIRFARNFGELQVHESMSYVNPDFSDKDYPEIHILSNLDKYGNPTGKHPYSSTLYWHTDGSWMRRAPFVTLMYAESVASEGGETHFCNMYHAYEELSAQMKERLNGLRAIHNLNFTRSRRYGKNLLTEFQSDQVTPMAHPIISTHTKTGRKCIFLGDHAESIQGMDYEEGRALIEKLNQQIVQDCLIYSHKWKPQQLLVWDNRSLLHRGTAYDYAKERRVMASCTVLGDEPH